MLEAFARASPEIEEDSWADQRAVAQRCTECTHNSHPAMDHGLEGILGLRGELLAKVSSRKPTLSSQILELSSSHTSHRLSGDCSDKQSVGIRSYMIQQLDTTIVFRPIICNKHSLREISDVPV